MYAPRRLTNGAGLWVWHPRHLPVKSRFTVKLKRMMCGAVEVVSPVGNALMILAIFVSR